MEKLTFTDEFGNERILKLKTIENFVSKILKYGIAALVAFFSVLFVLTKIFL